MFLLGGDRREQNARAVKPLVVSSLGGNFTVADCLGLLSMQVHVEGSFSFRAARSESCGNNAERLRIG